MKQSIKVLLFGVLYAVIALVLIDEAHTIGLVYACLAGFTAILYVLLDTEEERIRILYNV